MVDQLSSNYSDIVCSHIYWIVGTVVILLICSALGPLVGPRLSTELIQRLLTTLITALSSFLAIVFSVLFISTQIASERYSPKFTVSFVNDPIVQLIFGLGIFSIISSLSILTISPQVYLLINASSNWIASGLLWITGGFLIGLSIVFFFLLYPFIRLILVQTTPDNILAQFKRQYDAPKFKKEAENANKVSNHPMQPVYDFARNAMKRGDYNTAISAVEILYQVPKTLLPQLVESTEYDVEAIFGPILNEYGRSLIVQADESNFSDVVSTASTGMSQLGAESVSNGEKEVYDETFSTVYSLFEESNQFNQDTNLSIVKCCSALFSSSAMSSDILVEYIPRQVQLVSGAADRGSISQLEECLHGAKRAHNIYLSSNKSRLSDIRTEEVLLGQKDKKPVWDRSSEDDSSPLLRCTYIIMQTTGEVLSQDDVGAPPGFVFESWESTIEESHAKGLDTHVEHLIRRYIELVVYTELKRQSGLSTPHRVSKMISDKNLEKATLSACDSILSENRPISDMNEFQFLEKDLPDIWEPIPMADYSDEFVSKVQEIKSRVNS
jgi:hypothetical protein